jgi:hypothetical protein
VGDYFRRLWRGELPLSRVFWTDMLIVGTLINALLTVASMMAFVAGVPAAPAVTIHFLPTPYNFALVMGVCRSAATSGSAWAGAAQVAAPLWFITALLI